MLSSALLTVLAGLAGCFSSSRVDVDDAPSPPSSPSGAPDPAGPWLATVQARIAAEQRAIRAEGDGFAADLPAARVSVRFDADGAALDGLTIRTRAWGRGDALAPVGRRAPAFGACSDAVDPSGACIRRLEYADPALTEWWLGRDDGLEQGWTLPAAPAGVGPLVLDVALDEATVLTVGDSATLVDGAGRRWTVGGLAARDADGRALPVRFARADGGLRVEVDDAGARYPVEIDPTYTTAAWTLDGTGAVAASGMVGIGDVNGDGYDDAAVSDSSYATNTGRVSVYLGSATGLASTATATIDGESSGSYFGRGFAGADVDGDGYGDLIVTAPYYGSSEGRVYVFRGSAAGLSTTSSTTITGSASTSLGSAVAAAGDVNGDGYGDVAVATSTITGQVRVYHGSAAGLASTATTTISGSSLGLTYFGSAVGGAGDVNHDGYADLLVSQVYYGTYTGRVYVFHGSASGVGTSYSRTLTGPAMGSFFGDTLGPADDVNGDGYDDVVVGAQGYSSSTGAAYVYLGGSTGLSSTIARTLTGPASSSYFGQGCGIADVNGDGYADVFVGAYGYSSSTGRAYVYPGSSSGVASTASTTLTGEATSSQFGLVIGAAGDVNDDGNADLLVSAPQYGAVGRAYAYHGASTGLSTSAATTWTGVSADRLGIAVSGAGDVNDDGYADVIVGAEGYGGYTGRAWLFQGGASGLSTSASTTLTGVGTGTYFGHAVAGAGDVDGDGYDDVVVGAPTSSGGYAWLFSGSASGLSSTAAASLTVSGATYFGGAVSGAGDVNGDHFADVVVGAHSTNSYTGAAYLFAGSSAGLATTPATTLAGSTYTVALGYAVAGAGDVNGDGYDDVLVGSPWATSYTGRAAVYPGSAAGLSTTAAITLTGPATYAYFGGAVAGAGDVNRDGYDDVIVGSYGYSASTGQAAVYLGSATGLSSTAATTFTGTTAGEELGGAVAGAGDLDGDGYDDVAIGASAASTATGRVAVYAGSAAGLSTTAATSLTGSATRSYFGAAIAGVGDVDADGYADLLVGSYGAGASAGRAELYRGYADADADGVVATADCDDHDASVTVEVTRYVDADGDGYGDTPGTACPDVAGYADVDGDCDDTDAAISPAAVEQCDAADTDEDCDGVADDASATGQSTFYADTDSDGYGSTTSAASCDRPAGYVATSTDCDDSSASIHPGATEVCDSSDTDEDCDGVADDASATGQSTFYADTDSDGYGSATSAASCDQPAGYVATSTDCDDSSASIHPGATEVCDSADTDEDCDGVADDASATGQSTFYADTDSDGYGSTTSAAFCDRPAGYVATSTDCDDSSASIHPGATEVCDAADTDEDCDGVADDDDASATGKATAYADTDGDGYGSTTSVAFCDRPAGYVATSTDCDDSSASIHPGATEVCDAADTDEDCDGVADDDDSSATGQSTFYADTDSDGYGSTTGAAFCDRPAGYVATSTDCDDSSGSIHPGATEACDSADTDEDCDGAADDDDASATGQATAYADTDGDGYGSATSAAFCDRPAGYVATSTDCDDSSASIHPGATDAAGDAVDADCDGTESCYTDADEDGARTAFLVASTDTDCSDVGEAPSSAVTDCDDGDAATFPGATELVADEVDQDCDGGETCYIDADADGYVADDSTVTSSDADCTDAGEAAATALSGDCDDDNAAFNPAAEESDCADPADYNCDGSSGYADADGDGYAACEECDDGDATVTPDATELPGDGIDGDCDGFDRCYVDADGDGYRTTDVIDGTTVACDGASEAALTAAEDCDDDDATVSPAATDAVGDELDQDCDGAERCWADADGDAVRAADGSTVDSTDTDCTDAGEAPSSAADGDCDDTDPTVSPFAAEEVADAVDQDCDGGDTCWADADEDGYAAADGSTVLSADLACDAPGEAAVAGDDCDDTDANTNPDAEELVGDEIDADCDGAELCYADADADGYTDGSDVDSLDTDCADAGELAADQGTGDCDDTDAAYNPAAAETDCADPADYNCDGSSGYGDGDGDGFAACEECDDADAAVNPDATELAGDAVDQDCDLAEDCYVDADGDGARLEDLVTSTDADCGDAGEALTSANLDCDDADATVSPSATEAVGDGIDADCDGFESCYVDSDGDGYAPDGGATVESTDADCADAGEASDTTPTGDCDDTSVAFSPGAEESDCTDPADYNCDGSSGYADTDGDGFAACEECDDALGTVNPDADEVCNGVDDDCDGGIDVHATDASTWYADADGDGYTDPDVSTLSCDAPGGYAAATEDDCDDEDPAAFPGADEVPDDGVDQDCDGDDLVTDEGDDTGTPTDDTGGDDTGTPSDDKDPGCGCQTGGSAVSLAGLGLLLLAISRRPLGRARSTRDWPSSLPLARGSGRRPAGG